PAILPGGLIPLIWWSVLSHCDHRALLPATNPVRLIPARQPGKEASTAGPRSRAGRHADCVGCRCPCLVGGGSHPRAIPETSLSLAWRPPVDQQPSSNCGGLLLPTIAISRQAGANGPA